VRSGSSPSKKSGSADGARPLERGRSRRRAARGPLLSLSLRAGVCRPAARARVGLLGPCFKTGRSGPFRRRPRLRWASPSSGRTAAFPASVSDPGAWPLAEERGGPPPKGRASPSFLGPRRGAAKGSGPGRKPRARLPLRVLPRGEPAPARGMVRARARPGPAPEGGRRSAPFPPTPTSGPRPERTVPRDAGLERFPPNGFRRFWLSFQSPFHLSLTVLVRYRSPAYIEPWMGLTTPFGLRSQAARLRGVATTIEDRGSLGRRTGLSPSLAPRPRGSPPRAVLLDATSWDHSSGRLSSPRLMARALPSSLAATEGIPVGFFSSA